MVRRDWVLALLLGIAGSTTQLLSQPGGPPQPPATPRAAADMFVEAVYRSLATQ